MTGVRLILHWNVNKPQVHFSLLFNFSRLQVKHLKAHERENLNPGLRNPIVATLSLEWPESIRVWQPVVMLFQPLNQTNGWCVAVRPLANYFVTFETWASDPHRETSDSPTENAPRPSPNLSSPTGLWNSPSVAVYHLSTETLSVWYHSLCNDTRQILLDYSVLKHF